jgi:hypothetical protein
MVLETAEDAGVRGSYAAGELQIEGISLTFSPLTRDMMATDFNVDVGPTFDVCVEVVRYGLG